MSSNMIAKFLTYCGFDRELIVLQTTITGITTTPHHNRFMALFLGPPGWASTRRELLDFMVQGKINRGRHTDHPPGTTPSGL